MASACSSAIEAKLLRPFVERRRVILALGPRWNVAVSTAHEDTMGQTLVRAAGHVTFKRLNVTLVLPTTDLAEVLAFSFGGLLNRRPIGVAVRGRLDKSGVGSRFRLCHELSIRRAEPPRNAYWLRKQPWIAAATTAEP